MSKGLFCINCLAAQFPLIANKPASRQCLLLFIPWMQYDALPLRSSLTAFIGCMQELRIHPDWSAESPVDWKQFFCALQTGSKQCSVNFQQGPLKDHCIPVTELLSLPMPSIAAVVMQYKQLCHDQLGQYKTINHQQQWQPHYDSSEVDVALIKEYVAIGMVGSEADPLEPFRLETAFPAIMRADMAWLDKWYRVLVSS